MNVCQLPDALLLLSSQCPHCPVVLAGLTELIKRGEIGRLEVVNLECHPQAAQALGVRGVPWLRLGPFELSGARGGAEIALWAARAQAAASPDGYADAFHDLLKQADLEQVRRLIQADPARLASLLPIVANPEASLNVKLGVGVLFEDYAGHAALRAVVDDLGKLTGDDDARVRADAAHLLSLTQSDAARPWLRAALRDANAEVREIAAESLQSLGEST
jgi:HEAT repeat protein